MLMGEDLSHRTNRIWVSFLSLLVVVGFFIVFFSTGFLEHVVQREDLGVLISHQRGSLDASERSCEWTAFLDFRLAECK